MVIMDMATVQNKAKLALAISFALASSYSYAGNWQFTPDVELSETYTDNVNLVATNKQSSYVAQSKAALATEFKSRIAEFKLDVDATYASYSHNHDLDGNFRHLNSEGFIQLWNQGPKLTFAGKIDNISRNSADNSLADLVSGNTVESRYYQTGLNFDRQNSLYQISSNLSFSSYSTEDNIGESQGYGAIISSRSGSGARNVLWQIQGAYSDRTNQQQTGQAYNVEAIVGWLSGWQVNPFIRYFDEDTSGTITSEQNTATRSWGPGLRFRLARHLLFDVSYNYTDNSSVTDDYIAAAISWQPSNRTNLQLGYNKRFFGNSYRVKFEHKIKRLTNSISYNEQVQAFDRNTFEQVNLGSYWCPAGSDSYNIADCFVVGDTPLNFDNYQLVTFFDQNLIQGNEFALNKVLNWLTELQLARTRFVFNADSRERESLTTARHDKNLAISFDITRQVSPHSEAGLTAQYRKQQYNSENNTGQRDYYRALSAHYERKLSAKLTTRFNLQFLDRNSTLVNRTYQESRISVSLTKTF